MKSFRKQNRRTNNLHGSLSDIGPLEPREQSNYQTGFNEVQIENNPRKWISEHKKIEHVKENSNDKFSKVSKKDIRIKKTIDKYDLFNKPYHEKVGDSFVYSDVPFKFEGFFNKESGYNQIETLSIEDPVTNKIFNYVEVERISKTKETGYGSQSKVYLINAYDSLNQKSGQIRILEFDRNMNLLGTTIFSESDVPKFEKYEPKKMFEGDIVPDSRNFLPSKQEMIFLALENDVLTDVNSKTIASKYSQPEIRTLASKFGVKPKATDEKTVNAIKKAIKNNYNFDDNTEETQLEMEELLK